MTTPQQPVPPDSAFVMPLLLVIGSVLLLILVVLLLRMSRLGARLRRFDARVKRAEGDLLRTRRSIGALRVAQSLAAAGRAPALPFRFASQYGEDLFLYDLFEGKTDGLYIEVGAYDGYTCSVTYAFEAMGWSGVLIEAIPERYKACLERRPGSQVAHAALGRRGSTGNTTFTVVGDAGDPGSEMLSFLSKSPAHARLLKRSKAPRREVTVPLSTMDEVLAAAERAAPPGRPSIAGRPIDFAVVDVEGAEIEVFEGFDLEARRVRVLVVEDMEPRNAASPSAYLSRRHYTIAARVGVSSVFIRSDEPDLIRRARMLTQPAD
ncbi:MAG: FkbM family methyltransferase [Phycisphaeraceae bacterium]|nr:FkbM family methyltransferase [Phycisphaeraceae bacterium]